mgnify:CR=1 FL=1
MPLPALAGGASGSIGAVRGCRPIAASTTVWGRVGHSFRLANADEFSYTNFGTFLLPQTSRDVEFGARWAAGAYKLEARGVSAGEEVQAAGSGTTTRTCGRSAIVDVEAGLTDCAGHKIGMVAGRGIG